MAPCHSSSAICTAIVRRGQDNRSSSTWCDDDRTTAMTMEWRKTVYVENAIVKTTMCERVRVASKPVCEGHHMASACPFSMRLICSSGALMLVTRRDRFNDRKKSKKRGTKS